MVALSKVATVDKAFGIISFILTASLASLGFLTHSKLLLFELESIDRGFCYYNIYIVRCWVNLKELVV